MCNKLTKPDFLNAGYSPARAATLASEPATNWKAQGGGKRGVAKEPRESDKCVDCGHNAEDHHSDEGYKQCWHGSGSGNTCPCQCFKPVTAKPSDKVEIKEVMRDCPFNRQIGMRNKILDFNIIVNGTHAATWKHMPASLTPFYLENLRGQRIQKPNARNTIVCRSKLEMMKRTLQYIEQIKKEHRLN